MRIWGTSLLVGTVVMGGAAYAQERSLAVSKEPVRQLWSTGLTNTWMLYPSDGTTTTSSYHGPWTNYHATAVKIDPRGNTIVGGTVAIIPPLDTGSATVAACVIKFDSKGNRLWEYTSGTNADGGIEGLDVDKEGDVFISTRPEMADLCTLALIKLSPTGDEVWRVSHEGVPGGIYAPVSSLSVDRHSGGVLLDVAATNGTNASPLTVSKYDRHGRLLWNEPLPGAGYNLGEYNTGMAKTIQATADGGAVVIGMQDGTFLTKFSASGRTLWRRLQPRNCYATVSLSSTGCLLTTGSGVCLYRPDGVLIRACDYGLELVPNDEGNLFLVWEGDFVEAINLRGLSLWQRHTGLPYGLALGGALADSRGGWLVVGLARPQDETGLQFVRLSGDGAKLWRSSLFSIESVENQPRGGYCRASDGTVRVVYNAGPSASSGDFYNRGIRIMAFRER